MAITQIERFENIAAGLGESQGAIALTAADAAGLSNLTGVALIESPGEPSVSLPAARFIELVKLARERLNTPQEAETPEAPPKTKRKARRAKH